jgi:hypothetical protein
VNSKSHWNDAKPWHTNAALIGFGLGLIAYTRQLISEGDHYTHGTDFCSKGSLVLYLGACLLVLSRKGNTDRLTFPIILTFAIATRIVGLFPDPFLSSDVYRYAWDGVVQHAGINPYRYVPGDAHLAFLRGPNQDLFANMNRRDYAHTIYPPVAQMIFYAVTWLAPTVTFMKTAMVLFEGLALYGMTLVLGELGLRREWVLLYAWCPLCIWEFGSSGHLDAIVIAFMVFAFLFRLRGKPGLTGLFLGLAVLTKFYPLVLFSALYQRRPDGRLDWKMPAVMAALAVGSYSIYLSVGKQVFGFLNGYVEEEGMATGTRYFLLDFAQRLPGLHGVGNGAFLVFAGGVFLALMAWCWTTCCRAGSARATFLASAMSLALATMLLFSPHYPWYVAWLVPFLVFCPSLTVLAYVSGLFYLCTTALATGYGAPQFHLNEILYATVAVAAIIEIALCCVPATRCWMRRVAPYSFAFDSYVFSVFKETP